MRIGYMGKTKGLSLHLSYQEKTRKYNAQLFQFFIDFQIDKKIHRIADCPPMNFKYSAGDLKSPAEYCFKKY